MINNQIGTARYLYTNYKKLQQFNCGTNKIITETAALLPVEKYSGDKTLDELA